MPIFIISGDELKKIPVKSSGMDIEKKLQTLIEKNLKTIFDMTYIETEFSTTHGGRIDTLAIDSDRRPVIIEYKLEKSSTVLLQGLYYMDWLFENKAEFEKLVRNKLHKDIDINWKSGIRLVLIAKSFEIWDKFAVNRIKEEVDLYEYTLYENDQIKLDKATLPKDFKSSPKTSITSTSAEYSPDSVMNKIKDIRIKKIVTDLREKLRLISHNVEERATKGHIIFKSSLNFVAIYPQQKQYWFDVKMPREEVRKQFKELDVRPHKDKVFTHIRCNEDTDIEQLVTLAEQAFESTK